jgi:CO/xanthine dehydrogenase FAD-binding subunit
MGAPILSRRRSTLVAVDVLTPRTLEESLRMKAERLDAVPIQGGTDVMVDLNFDRARPPALLNLNEVAELRGWSRENGTLWLGAGLTYTEAMQPPLSDVLPALAEASRTGGPRMSVDVEPLEVLAAPRQTS